MIKRTVKEIAEFFGVDVGVERGGIYLFAPLFNFGEMSSTLISDFSNYKEDDIIKPISDTDNYMDKINDEEIKEV